MAPWQEGPELSLPCFVRSSEAMTPGCALLHQSVRNEPSLGIPIAFVQFLLLVPVIGVELDGESHPFFGGSLCEDRQRGGEIDEADARLSNTADGALRSGFGVFGRSKGSSRF